MTLYNDAIEAINQAIRERFNVTSTDSLPAFADAIKAARAGDLGPLEMALADREMYRWGPVITEQLAEAHRTRRINPETALEPEGEGSKDAEVTEAEDAAEGAPEEPAPEDEETPQVEGPRRRSSRR